MNLVESGPLQSLLSLPVRSSSSIDLSSDHSSLSLDDDFSSIHRPHLMRDSSIISSSLNDPSSLLSPSTPLIAPLARGSSFGMNVELNFQSITNNHANNDHFSLLHPTISQPLSDLSLSSLSSSASSSASLNVFSNPPPGSLLATVNELHNASIQRNNAMITNSQGSSSTNHKRTRMERGSSDSGRDSPDSNSSPNDGLSSSSSSSSVNSAKNKREEHRERHRQLDANRRSREAAAVMVLQKYAFPDNSTEKDGKAPKSRDKVTVLVRAGELLKELTEQNASYASQLNSFQHHMKAMQEERDRMSKEIALYRDRCIQMEKERITLKERVAHTTLLTTKMQEKLLTVQNAAMIAAANTAAPSLAPFLDDESKNSSFKTEQSTPKFDFSSPLSLQFISHQASLSIYESLFINSGVIMLAVNMQGILVAANRGMQRFLHSMGINYEDIVGRAICPFASKPGFAQLKEFLVYQRRREAERQKVFGPPDPSTIDPLISNHCPLPTTLTSCWDSNAFVCDKKDGEDEISHTNGGSSVTLPPAPAHFAKPYPATERMMQKLFAGQEQMVTATHRWASRDGRLYEMQMTSYIVTEDGIPKYCIGVTSDDLIVCQT